MRPRTAAIIAGVAVTGAVLAGGGIALAGGGPDLGNDDDSEAPISADALDHASAAALDHTGEGRVTDTEVDDEESYYEVEVTLDDGTEVDVQLDEQFRVVGSENEVDDDGSNDD